MLRKLCFIHSVLLLGHVLSENSSMFIYPTSYRDHVYHKLSENGKKIFFALNIHPSCAAKNGECMQRGKCIEKKMLYISRVCYKRDLVCCYDDTIYHPTIRPDDGPKL
ncbi:unnamed protein product [Leptidea sinapis]|uniref:Beta-defensin n=1 Tax=Leptidea sinapis TaxID=189913 RepID=A0A5E4Q2B0_9NEOP|nr:unnamed protein product [Leptidea sinapis]